MRISYFLNKTIIVLSYLDEASEFKGNMSICLTFVRQLDRLIRHFHVA